MLADSGCRLAPLMCLGIPLGPLGTFRVNAQSFLKTRCRQFKGNIRMLVINSKYRHSVTDYRQMTRVLPCKLGFAWRSSYQLRSLLPALKRLGGSRRDRQPSSPVCSRRKALEDSLWSKNKAATGRCPPDNSPSEGGDDDWLSSGN